MPPHKKREATPLTLILEAKGESVTDSEAVFNKVWNLLKDAIHREANKPGSSRNQVAKRLKVAPTTVNRWLDGDRGARVSLRQTLNIMNTLGISMEEVLRELTPDNTALILVALQKYPNLLSDILQIIAKGDSTDIQKLGNEAEYIKKKID